VVWVDGNHASNSCHLAFLTWDYRKVSKWRYKEQAADTLVA